MNDTRTVSLDLSCLDVSALSQYSKKEVSSILFDNWDLLLQDNYNRVKEIIESGSFRKDMTSEEQQYCPSQQKTLELLFKRGAKACKPFLLGNLYIASYYEDISCHYLFFGKEKQVELYGRNRFFVSHFRNFPLEKREALLDILRNDPLLTNNPLYIFRERCKDVARANGVSLRTLMSFRPTSSLVGAKRTAFIDSDISPMMIKKSGEPRWTSNTIIPVIAYYICGAYDISADYLIQRDYSKYAGIDGQSLNDEEKSALSLFIRATTNAQDEVLHHLLQLIFR